jgi:hypothetical protein
LSQLALRTFNWYRYKDVTIASFASSLNTCSFEVSLSLFQFVYSYCNAIILFKCRVSHKLITYIKLVNHLKFGAGTLLSGIIDTAEFGSHKN